ncbi:hypothetical protein ACFCWD_29310 [Streptomyces sp. NPDC056374]|uniref:hypothetical protein n=1 Tax=unclassified Streptomyces TaxID=2593676 RepID=UPI0035DAD12D
MSGGTGNNGSGRAAATASRWARARFGKRADGLAAGIPRRLAHAHERARAVHDKAELKKRGPYGHVLAEAVLEELAEEALALGGTVRELRGYDFAVINGWALFPFKYSDRPIPLDRARLRADASAQRKRLLTAHGPDPDEGLFPLQDVPTTIAYDEIHQAFEELGRSTKLISVFFTAARSDGIHSFHWGEARLEDDRTFTWSHVEPLPPLPVTGG